MQLTHLGHACLLIEMADERILVDPGNMAADWDEVTGLSAVVITHQHPDHLDQDRLPRLLRSNPEALVLCDTGSADILRGMAADPVVQTGTEHQVGQVRIRPVGDMHAVIHEDLPRIPNIGVVFSAEGEPSLYHTGDALDGDPGRVDVVSFPLSAPWQASKEMVAFLRRVDAAVAVPVHDGTVSPAGRNIYLNQALTLGCQDRLRLLDLAGAGPSVVAP
ncbi:MAG: MBL fold metallo-hydrolase [Nostocoides sp.]